MKFKIATLLCTGLLAFAVNTAQLHAAEVNVYSARQEELIKPLLDKFTADTQIKVNLITGNPDELISRIASEGRNSPADILISTDVGRLYRAKQQGILQAIKSPELEQAIPEALRDPAGYWYSLTMRARPILYVAGKVDPAQLSTYEDLADAKWKGRICVRSSNNIYNQSMVASFIAHNGVEKAEQWTKGFVANLATKPTGGDREQIKAAAAGVCDIAIANTYYLGRLLGSEKEKASIENIRVFWPNQKDRGVHVNISGAGVAKHAPNKEQAIVLLQYMLRADSQQWYAQINQEYPVLSGVKASEILQSFGEFKADDLQLDKLGELNAEAIRVMDRAGWK